MVTWLLILVGKGSWKLVQQLIPSQPACLHPGTKKNIMYHSILIQLWSREHSPEQMYTLTVVSEFTQGMDNILPIYFSNIDNSVKKLIYLEDLLIHQPMSHSSNKRKVKETMFKLLGLNYNPLSTTTPVLEGGHCLHYCFQGYSHELLATSLQQYTVTPYRWTNDTFIL